MKKIVLLVVFLFLLICPKVFAQDATPTPDGTIDSTTISGDGEDSNTFTLNPPLNSIDDFITTVSVQFNNPDITSQSSNIFVCMEGDMCIDNDDIRDGINDGKQGMIDKAIQGLGEGDVDEGTIQRYKLVNGKIVVCGDGKTKLKASEQKYYQGSNGNFWGEQEKKRGCKEERDFFHAGSTHLMNVYQKSGGNNPIYSIMAVGGFYVNHGMPKEPIINPKVNILPKKDRFEITLSSDKIRAGGGSRNNYQITLDGPGANSGGFLKDNKYWIPGNGQRCVTLSSQKNSQSVVLPNDTTLSPGRYVVQIKEQINEDTSTDRCQGGFKYYRIDCNVSFTAAKSSCSEVMEDPGKVDLNSLSKLFVALGDKGPGSSLPCRQGKTVNSPLDCPEIDTAIGSIKVDLVGFTARLFSIVLSIAGVAALSLIIFSGYKLLISRGNKEVIQGARETLTAAIVGLLFIVLSLVILSIIGGDILKIPGFG